MLARRVRPINHSPAAVLAVFADPARLFPTRLVNRNWELDSMVTRSIIQSLACPYIYNTVSA